MLEQVGNPAPIRNAALSNMMHSRRLGGQAQLCLCPARLQSSTRAIVINSIHSREGSYTYIKDIVRGECELPLSDEEAEAVKTAITSTSPQPTTTTVTGGKKIRKVKKTKESTEETSSKSTSKAKKTSVSETK